MDEMKIKTPFMRSLFGRLLAKALKKGLGVNADINISYLNVVFDDAEGRIYLTANASIPKDEISKLIKNI